MGANRTMRTFPRGTVFRINEWYGWNGSANEGLRMTATEIARGEGYAAKIGAITDPARPLPLGGAAE